MIFIGTEYAGHDGKICRGIDPFASRGGRNWHPKRCLVSDKFGVF
jgi:hypothetical protein